MTTINVHKDNFATYTWPKKLLAWERFRINTATNDMYNITFILKEIQIKWLKN